MTLRKKVFKAGNWVLSGHFLSQVIRLGGNLVLTRLLVPEMFGLMAIVTVALNGIAMFSDLGINQNIIQSKNANKKSYINTAWAVQILRGVIIFFFMLLLSAFLYSLRDLELFPDGSVYTHPELPLILAVMSVAGLIAGFNSMNLALLNRELELKKVIQIEVISQVIGILFMVFLAYNLRNIWALVFGTLVASSVKMILSHHSSLGEKYSWEWDGEALQEMLHFGKWIFGASMFTFLVAQGDRLLLGALITPYELGVYTIAFFLAMAFNKMMRKVMSSVLYAALSDVVRNRPQDLKRIYYKMRAPLDLVVMVVVGVLASTGHLVIDFLYDDRYREAGWMLEILSLPTIFLGTTMAGLCFMALGDSKYIMLLTGVSALSLFILVPVSFYLYGIQGAVIAIALNSIVEIPLILYKMNQYKLLSWIDEFKAWPVFFLVYGLGHYITN
ncbi:MAG: oligosaccharide flippase family protein [Cycloclasticus sp.]|nr:oligosaccharide flippase family protein [Cycloclasticus sp.]